MWLHSKSQIHFVIWQLVLKKEKCTISLMIVCLMSISKRDCGLTRMSNRSLSKKMRTFSIAESNDVARQKWSMYCPTKFLFLPMNSPFTCTRERTQLFFGEPNIWGNNGWRLGWSNRIKKRKDLCQEAGKVTNFLVRKRREKTWLLTILVVAKVNLLILKPRSR